MAAPARHSPALSVRGLSKTYGSLVAVDSLDLRIEPGEIYGLLGPNGAGKTTSLECILGLRRADQGTIEIGGIDAIADPQGAKRRVGAQLQGAGLQDPLTARQALAFFRSFYPGADSSEDLLQRFGLGEKANARFETLSTGQRQRLFLAMAFIHRPAVMVLDEPTSGLDPQARRELHGLIQSLRDQGVAVLMSTHDLSEAEHLCSRIGILVSGRLVAHGSPAEIIGRVPAAPILAIQLRKVVDAPTLLAIPGIRAADADGLFWTLRLNTLNEGLGALISHVQASGNEIVDLQMRRPSLEDAFVALTGQAWINEEGTP